MKILFAASEAYPLIKTGGLADVLYGLPKALAQLGHEVKLVVPGYRTVLQHCSSINYVSWCKVTSTLGKTVTVRIAEATSDQLQLPILLVDQPQLFDRDGNPYLNESGENWIDNAERFSTFSKVVAEIARNSVQLHWRPDIVHIHDWQTGLVAPYISRDYGAVKTVFTIHNLSYGGIFSRQEFDRLQLPHEWWHHDLVEFYGNFSMLKAGIAYADKVTTVSPTYAREITMPHLGYGFDGLLRASAHKFSGILNGIDEEIWQPASDSYIPYNYDVTNYIEGKRANKLALMQYFYGDTENDNLPILGFIGRMVSQKGIDLLAGTIEQLIPTTNAVFVILGSGEHHFEHQFNALKEHYPDRVKVQLGYSEQLAHLIEAGCDMFIMPSRFEPCGLNQLYSLAYGTLPVVHAVGGLADTVINATTENIAAKTATGFSFYEPSVHALTATIRYALEQFANPQIWQQLVTNAMSKDYSWAQSAQQYQRLYQEARHEL